MKLVAIDFETANSRPQSACAVGVLVFDEGVEIDRFYSLIQPQKRDGWFDWRNVRIHHIQPEDVADAPGFDQIYQRLQPYFSDSLFVAHNADFDMQVFGSCCLAWDLPVPDLTYFCTVKLTQRMFPFLEHHRLNDCCEYMHIELDHHQALSDASACGQIVLNCMVAAGETQLEDFVKHCQVPLVSLQKRVESWEKNQGGRRHGQHRKKNFSID